MPSEKMNLIPWILIIGALIIAFAFFSFTMLGWCSHTSVMPPLPATGVSFDDKYSAFLSLESHSITFQYKAELGAAAAEGANQTQCVICLTPFEEEENVRKLHSCKHVFHTSCIDKWFGSHSGCPLCRRSQIDKVASPNGTVRSEENSQMIFVNVNP